MTARYRRSAARSAASVQGDASDVGKASPSAPGPVAEARVAVDVAGGTEADQVAAPVGGQARRAAGRAERIVGAGHREAANGSALAHDGPPVVCSCGGMSSRSVSGGATSKAARTRRGVRECAAQAATSWQPRLWATSTAGAGRPQQHLVEPRHPVAAARPQPVVLLDARRRAAPPSGSASGRAGVLPARQQQHARRSVIALALSLIARHAAL